MRETDDGDGNLTYNEFADLVKWGQSPEKLPNSFSLEMSLMNCWRQYGCKHLYFKVAK